MENLTKDEVIKLNPKWDSMCPLTHYGMEMIHDWINWGDRQDSIEKIYDFCKSSRNKNKKELQDALSEIQEECSEFVH